MNRVDILLSTYNSSCYLDKIIGSLLNQTYTNYKILVRDDCSKDNTMELLQNFKDRFSDKIFIISNHNTNLGAKYSFQELLKYSDSPYIMFCDHDDYWLPHKIEMTLNKVLELECGKKDTPILVYTDLKIVDYSLNPICDSFWAYSKIDPNNIHNHYKLSINNPVVGCTVMINMAAKHIVLPIPQKAIMHDWWFAFMVSKFGKVDYINEPTILYRKHENNTMGVRKAELRYFLNRTYKFKKTLKQNLEVFQMLRLVNKNASILKFFWYKILILMKK